MSNMDYILNLCCDLSEQGKSPSVALIRSMANQPLTIPEVIKGLQRWKANPSVRPEVKTPQRVSLSKSQQSLEQRVAELEAQVSALTDAFSQLKKS